VNLLRSGTDFARDLVREQTSKSIRATIFAAVLIVNCSIIGIVIPFSAGFITFEKYSSVIRSSFTELPLSLHHLDFFLQRREISFQIRHVLIHL
jgi:hypothetical protein